MIRRLPGFLQWLGSHGRVDFLLTFIVSYVVSIHRPVYEKRVTVLSRVIVSCLKAGDKVLDIGCGSGQLGEAVLKHDDCPNGIVYRGLEKFRRGREPIKVIEHQAGPLPFQDQEFDVVILADVLHHEQQEDFLLSEAARVAKRYLLVKDHKPEGFLGFWRICVLDWAANAPHGVRCLYRYRTKKEWHELFAKHGLRPVVEKTSIDLYPPLFNLVFGRRLQYFVALKK